MSFYKKGEGGSGLSFQRNIGGSQEDDKQLLAGPPENGTQRGVQKIQK